MAGPNFPQRLYVASVEDADLEDSGFFSAVKSIDDLDEGHLDQVAEYQLVRSGHVEQPKRRFKPFGSKR